MGTVLRQDLNTPNLLNGNLDYSISSKKQNPIVVQGCLVLIFQHTMKEKQEWVTFRTTEWYLFWQDLTTTKKL